ncbi:SDR family oxidoreductase [Frigoribacterium faeni]|uniref:LysR family transcriptional regulator n=1 Tax=Frigoribacterium faeni TaxID=145483 RepID=A0A7W3JKQ6_9MICO|nr:NADH(P)-binding protein [Frigoribacterium faeni]MBA8814642.1 threonine dehydrogenase-like Zn-dependent dehydrogenase [Frigoribacterium faeni]BFF15558.1 SDR family oxidoreductase [Microbacterium flavescens]GEK83535.1 LysR family transcriptional regulator [Frigoribacterium faeni]
MRVAVIGGGVSGNAIVRAVEARGCSATRLSRSTGFDVLRDDARAALAGADVIIEATGRFTTNRKKATAFFTGSTRALSLASRDLGARHVLLSIVNCTRPEVQGYGYFAGKTAQEQAALAASPDLTIVRSTQWHEFVHQNLERMKVGSISLVPGMTIAPVALEAVASVLADVTVADRTDAVIEIAGPETTTLWEMTKAATHGSITPVPVRIPGRLGRAFRDGALLPGAHAEVVGPRFRDWLAAQSS